MEGKKIRATVVGFGNRGQTYADYALQEPEEFEVAAIVDPNDFKLQEAKKRYHLSDECLFHNFEEFVNAHISCDFVINATMDQYHYQLALQILSGGYNMLIEKPIVPDKEKLMDIAKLAEEKGAKVFVCHVLRYTPFYQSIKKILNEGTIGNIMTMEMNEHVKLSHYLGSYVRGKWNSEKNCGSGFIMAKCCHDFDLMCWLNNSTVPQEVASFGNRSQFVPENTPREGAEFCYQCKYEKECPYSAIDLYMNKNSMPFLVWDKLNKPLDEITDKEKMEHLKHDIYGKCAYLCGGDITDRQNSIVMFKNGSLATFNVIGGSQMPSRSIHIVGTMGEISGNLEDDAFAVRTYSRETKFGKVKRVEVHPFNKLGDDAHSGGDYAIMHDLVRYMNGDRSSISITSLEDSVNGHLCVYAAEESRKTHKIIKL